MARAYSEDLRKRVIDAVLAGASCLVAGERFGVSESSAIKWTRRYRQTGETSAKAMGGDRRSQRIEAHGEIILGALEDKPDITLQELQDHLAERGQRFGKATFHRFFVRHRLTLKKRPPTRRNRRARTSPRRAKTGAPARAASMPGG